jgi:hypothetical protein
MRPIGTSSRFSMYLLGKFLSVPDRDRWGAIARLSPDYTEMRSLLVERCDPLPGNHPKKFSDRGFNTLLDLRLQLHIHIYSVIG